MILACLIHFRVSRMSGAHLRDFVPGPTHQGCNQGWGDGVEAGAIYFFFRSRSTLKNRNGA